MAELQPWEAYYEESGFMKKIVRRKQKKTGMLLIGCVVMVLCGVFTINTIQLEGKKKEYSQKIEEYQKNIAQLEEDAEEIKELKLYVQTKGYIEQMAREKLGLIYKDEIIFKANEK